MSTAGSDPGIGPSAEDATAPTGPARITSAADLLARLDQSVRRGLPAGSSVVASGFRVLDDALGGGFRSGELVLLGGPQGLGKTTLVLQMVRNVVANGGQAVVFSLEHEAQTLVERLLSLEAATSGGRAGAGVHAIRRALESSGRTPSLDARLAGLPGVTAGLRTFRGYARRLHIHEASRAAVTLEEIGSAVADLRSRVSTPPLVVIDYLQKIRAPGTTENERVTRVVEGLKDLTVECGVPVLAVAAGDKAALARGRRMRVGDLRGSSALAYEADVVLILNEKYDIVARHHLVYDLANADRYREWVVMTVEKNRHGIDGAEMEFRKQFAHGRFDPVGQRVAEQLVEERLFTE